MGYKPERKVFNLEFVAYPGLEVTARSAPLGELSAAYDLNIKINEPDKEKRLESFKFFADRLISWNLEHPEVTGKATTAVALLDGPVCATCGLKEDEPMPPTVDSMMCLELDMIMAIIIGWINAIAKVSIPKGQSFNDGGTNIPEEVMKLLGTLESQTTLPMPNLSLD